MNMEQQLNLILEQLRTSNQKMDKISRQLDILINPLPKGLFQKLTEAREELKYSQGIGQSGEYKNKQSEK